jgi:hypothetical protein
MEDPFGNIVEIDSHSHSYELIYAAGAAQAFLIY